MIERAPTSPSMHKKAGQRILMRSVLLKNYLKGIFLSDFLNRADAVDKSEIHKNVGVFYFALSLD